MIKKISIAALVILIVLTGYSSDTKDAVRLKPAKHHGAVDVQIAKLFKRHHYKKMKLDDAFSSMVLDTYLRLLDYNKMYFLVDDIDSFEKYRHYFDNYLKVGELEAGFEIFNKYNQRLAERVAYIFKRLEMKFDFSKDESYDYNRKDSFWVQTSEELDELWRLRLKSEALNLKISGKQWKEIQETLKKRYNNLKVLCKQYNSEDVFQFYINAFARSIEPHTAYLSPKKSEDFKINMSLSLEGIGALLRQENDYTLVVRVIPGGPADRGKELKANDKIIGVGQGKKGETVDIIGWRVGDVVQLIRGKKGTYVRLQVIPAEAGPHDPPEIITIERDKVKLEEQAAQSEIIEIESNGKPYKIGLIDIPAFYVDFEAQRKGRPNYKSTTRDVKKLLSKLQQDSVQGIIIDLRDNGGGSLHEAIALTGLFIRQGPVVQVRDAYGKVEIAKDPDPGIVYTGPLVVFVNRNSASASEIFAAAIQDYQRGIIVGNQTYGKGTVQNLVNLNRHLSQYRGKLGQLKLTTAKFYRINGGSTQNRGVIPDIIFPTLFSREDYSESSKPNALPYDQIKAAGFSTTYMLQNYNDELRSNHKKRISSNLDFKFYLEDIKDYTTKKDKTRVSLNESVRLHEKEIEETKELNRKNARREAKGLQRITKEEDDEQQAVKDSVREAENEAESQDFFVTETAHILADLISFKKIEVPH